jgi:hypothetical protein
VTLAALAWYASKLLPNDHKAIHALMVRLTQAASVRPNESQLARLTYADRLSAFFTTNAVLHLETLSSDFPAISGRSDLVEAAMAARTQLRQAEFKLADLDVTFPPDKGTAKALVAITGQINFRTNDFGQTFRMILEKRQGRWLISQVESVERLQ